MNINTFKAVFPKADLITSPTSFFASIKHQYREYRTSGVYAEGDKAGFFVYRIKSQYGSFLGLLCCTSVDDLKEGKILKHEKTLASKEQQMMHLIMQRKALVKPVLLGYHPVDDIHEEFKEICHNSPPTVDVHFEEGDIHSIWTIYDKSLIQKILKSFGKLNVAYIGDGHHRSTTISLLNGSKEFGKEAEKYAEILTAYFPFDQLQIWDYNRVVDISDIMLSSEFCASLSKYFTIKKLSKKRKPKSKHELTFYIDRIWYSMIWKEQFTQKKNLNKVILDSALVNEYVFNKILKITDVRVDTRIRYFGGTEPMSALIKQSKKFSCGIGICIYPVSIEELTTLADRNKTLPPKSTWFLPRLKSGIIARDL